MNERHQKNEQRTKAIWTIPNILTFVRLILAFVVFFLISRGNLWWTATILFVIAVLTDALDGYLARALNQKSVLGRIFDPAVDKVIICGGFIFLQMHPQSGICPWVSTIVLSREFLITSLRGYMEQQEIDFSAQWSGKLKMVLQSIVIPVCMISMTTWGTSLTWFLWLRWFLIISMILITVYSGVEYLLKAELFTSPKDQKSDESPTTSTPDTTGSTT